MLHTRSLDVLAKNMLQESQKDEAVVFVCHHSPCGNLVVLKIVR